MYSTVDDWATPLWACMMSIVHLIGPGRPVLCIFEIVVRMIGHAENGTGTN